MRSLLSALLLAGALAPTGAAAGPLDGRWSLYTARAQCARDLTEADAPATIGEGRFDQYEAHCDWGPLTRAGAGVWTAPGRCLVEGVETRGRMRFVLAGDRLAMHMPDGGVTRMRRCPTRTAETRSPP